MPNAILLIFYDLGLGGVQTKIIDLINYYGARYPHITVHVLLRTRSRFDRGNLIRNPKTVFHVYTRDVPYIRGPFFFTLYVLTKCFIINPRAILGFLSPFSLPAILAKILFFWRKTTVVVNEDNYSSGVLKTYKYKILNMLGIRWLYPLTDHIIVPTQAVKNDLHGTFHIPADKLSIVRNWTTTRRTNSPSSHYACDLLYAGRLDKTKRVGTLLASVAGLKRLRAHITLRVIGDGTEKTRLKEYTRTHGLLKNVEFFSSVHDVTRLFTQSKIFVFSTQKRAEGFPFVVLEAMASGTPVLAYDFAGVRETILDGTNGYIYRNKNEFIEKCILLLNNAGLRKRFAHHAKITINKYHSPDNIRQYARLLGFHET